ncbi:MAG TPA: HlyD family efflux transporter periplasmic adaptor subunit [Thermoanaerobaculia bacterium]|jgi:HlyD family secretion protein|nr:HlyD family efflux transporter periplasmic adaptor subunit [Thermoanaerobaculia bacterium]
MSPKKIVIPIVLLAAAGAGVWYYTTSRKPKADGGLVAFGTVEATDAQLGFQAPGRVVSIAPREGDRVTAGQELARLERSELEARRAQAEAQVAAARANLSELEHGSRQELIAQARAAHTAAAERRSDAERDVARTRRLYEGGAVSREALDKAQTALDVARSQQTQAAEQLRLLQAGPSRETKDAARAQVAQAEAAVRGVDATLGNTVLAAPFDGVVTVRHREPGEIVPAGSPVVTVMDPRSRYVRIYIPENRVGAVRIGTRAAITADTYPGKTYPGEVSFIASEAEFTPKSVQTTEERVRLVYEVKVRVTGDPGFDLKPGLPADVKLEESK